MKYFFIFLIITFIFSCDKKQETVTQEQDSKPLLSLVNEYTSVKGVNATFAKDIADWKELKAVDNFLGRFKKVSPNEILSNALELQGLIKSLRDSVKPELFNIPSFNTRINIFYNESLRLSDMTAIPSIKADEVNKQTEKIIDAFSAVNSKVNTILSKKRFEDEIGIDITFIGLDSTKMDSVSRKSVNEKVQERLKQNSLSKRGIKKPQSLKKLKMKQQ